MKSTHIELDYIYIYALSLHYIYHLSFEIIWLFHVCINLSELHAMIRLKAIYIYTENPTGNGIYS